MGTTQRIVPGVPNKPNWGALNNSITRIAKTVQDENTNEENPNEDQQDQHDDNPEDQQYAKSYAKMLKRRAKHLRSSFRNLVKTGGGSDSISKGTSTSIGRAGLRSAKKFTSLFSSISSSGLKQTLSDLGFNVTDGMSFESVMDFLLVFCSGGDAGMDETAGNKAFSEVMSKIAESTNNDLDRFEEYIKEATDGPGLSDLLCTFWGLYIFEHLSQRFQEKITQVRGEEVSQETFKIIKEDILGQVKILNDERPISSVQWKSDEGTEVVEGIFKSILNIICDEN